ncbi:hypothetical protein DUI87_33339 [Hirundo rustica rustica]|uniref:Uncharacterized protein n=1 Tax=Hirundo rustica rustica TaxID=333673 RepID=A0A3M0J6U3_HIRRU|nr:hypothetical protein DUI87_33339 [Hirundo rustica rustica]
MEEAAPGAIVVRIGIPDLQQTLAPQTGPSLTSEGLENSSGILLSSGIAFPWISEIPKNFPGLWSGVMGVSSLAREVSPAESRRSGVGVQQRILCTLNHSLKDVLNYGLFQPAFNGRAGKFLDEERLLREYPLNPDTPVPYLEVGGIRLDCV